MACDPIVPVIGETGSRSRVSLITERQDRVPQPPQQHPARKREFTYQGTVDLASIRMWL